MRSVQTFSMGGTRMQRRVAQLRLALLPLRLSQISKLVVPPPHLRVFYVSQELVKRIVSKQSLYIMSRGKK